MKTAVSAIYILIKTTNQKLVAILRRRHLKCDETKPICARCRALNMACSYRLAPQFTVLTAGIHMGWLLAKQPSCPTTPSNIASSSITWQERRLAHLFRTELVAGVSGPFDTSFWTVHLLQAAQHYPALWYAATTFTAMYQQHHYRQNDATIGGWYRVALENYNKCIKYLLVLDTRSGSALSTNDKAALLAATLLLAAVCSLCNDHREAFIHIRNGLQLYQKWNLSSSANQTNPNSDSQATLLPIQSLVTLLRRIDRQIVTFNSFTTKPILPDESHLLVTDLGAAFASVTEAEVAFGHIHSAFYQGVASQMDNPQSATNISSIETEDEALIPMPGSYGANFNTDSQYQCRVAFGSWQAKLKDLIKTITPQSSVQDQEGILILQIHELSLYIALHADLAVLDPSEIELACDMFHPEIEQIINLSRNLCAHVAKYGTSFSFAQSVSETLWGLGQRCRDAKLRRQAIEVLRMWPMRELIWDPRIAAAVVEAVMIEEESAVSREADKGWCKCIAGEFICLGHRVMHNGLSFVDAKTIGLTLTSVNNVQNSEEGKYILIRI